MNRIRLGAVAASYLWMLSLSRALALLVTLQSLQSSSILPAMLGLGLLAGWTLMFLRRPVGQRFRVASVLLAIAGLLMATFGALEMAAVGAVLANLALTWLLADAAGRGTSMTVPVALAALVHLLAGTVLGHLHVFNGSWYAQAWLIGACLGLFALIPGDRTSPGRIGPVIAFLAVQSAFLATPDTVASWHNHHIVGITIFMALGLGLGIKSLELDVQGKTATAAILLATADVLWFDIVPWGSLVLIQAGMVRLIHLAPPGPLLERSPWTLSLLQAGIVSSLLLHAMGHNLPGWLAPDLEGAYLWLVAALVPVAVWTRVRLVPGSQPTG